MRNLSLPCAHRMALWCCCAIISLLLVACGSQSSTTVVAPSSLHVIAPTSLSIPPPAVTPTIVTLDHTTPAANALPIATPVVTTLAHYIRTRPTIPVLCYHAVRDWLASDSVQDRAYIVPVAHFAAQMMLLDQQHYHSITPDQLYDYLLGDATLPDHPILISSDDADETQWTNALPILQQHHFTATFFVMTVVLDKHGYLSSDQVRQLDRLGMTIGGHTWDHHRVTRYTGLDWDVQISQPTRRLSSIIGHPLRYFAYPYGLWNTEAISHIKAAGF